MSSDEPPSAAAHKIEKGFVPTGLYKHREEFFMPHVELKLPAICKGRTIFISQPTTFGLVSQHRQTDDLSPTTAKSIKLQR